MIFALDKIEGLRENDSLYNRTYHRFYCRTCDSINLGAQLNLYHVAF
jgi:hypothetical protein